MSGPGRYDTVGTSALDLDGRRVPYLRRRFLPQPEAVGPVQVRVNSRGERVDLIAATLLGDGERSWRIADANRVWRPSELSEPGAVVRVPLPSGVEVGGLGQ